MADTKYSNPIFAEGDDPALAPAPEPPVRLRSFRSHDQPTSPRNCDMAEEMAQKSFLEKFASFIGPGNVSAGAASALHVNIYLFALIVIVIVSWIAPNGHNPAVALLRSITEPLLRPIRNALPSSGGLDFSVMVALLIIYILKILIA